MKYTFYSYDYTRSRSNLVVKKMFTNLHESQIHSYLEKVFEYSISLRELELHASSA